MQIHWAKLGGILRHALTTTGGALVAIGQADPEVLATVDPAILAAAEALGGYETAAGAAMIVIGLLLSVVSPAKAVGAGDPTPLRLPMRVFGTPLAVLLVLGACAPSWMQSDRQVSLEQEIDYLVADIEALSNAGVDLVRFDPVSQVTAIILCNRLARYRIDPADSAQRQRVAEGCASIGVAVGRADETN